MRAHWPTSANAPSRLGLIDECIGLRALPKGTLLRLDKWLWAARFYKTRSLATDEIGKGRVSVNTQSAKPSREVRIGDHIELRQGPLVRYVVVAGLSEARGPAPVAQALYAETQASIAAREKAALERRESPEPALAIDQGRPTKRDRRQLSDWNRWSASIDGE
jgi:ribosome-associated heat shock protein Hsp15